MKVASLRSAAIKPSLIRVVKTDLRFDYGLLVVAQLQFCYYSLLVV